MNKRDHQKSRRDFLKKVGYTAPVILTMKAAPAFAKSGSGITRCRDGIGHKKHDIFDGPRPDLTKKFDKHFHKHVAEKKEKLAEVARKKSTLAKLIRGIRRFFS